MGGTTVGDDAGGGTKENVVVVPSPLTTTTTRTGERRGAAGIGGGRTIRNAASIALGPACLLGGSAAVYASASTTLSPLATLYMILLAIQYSLQPRVTKCCMHPDVDKKSAALVEETVKMTVAAGAFFVGGGEGGGGRNGVVEGLKGWTPLASLLVAGVPTSLYAVQGVLTYASYQNLDPVTFNGLSQTKMLSAAFCCYFVLGKPQSRIQIAALGLLSASAWIFQGTVTFDDLLGKLRRRSRKGGEGKGSSDDEGKVDLSDNREERRKRNADRFVKGVVPCLLTTFLSGLAGAMSQWGLQRSGAGGTGRDAYLYTMEVSFFLACCLAASAAFGRLKRRDDRKSGGGGNGNKKFFDRWTAKMFVPVVLKASGGVLMALAHKHAGSVVKGFALILGLVFATVLQSFFSDDEEGLTIEQIVGTALVMLSSWLHFAHPPTA